MKHQGYSLLEVLLSLIIMTGVASAMLQEHVRSGNFFNNLHQQIIARLVLNNKTELAYKSFY
jgi:prepilin-type N-terminal cleavage/methylation domain-containing protein